MGLTCGFMLERFFIAFKILMLLKKLWNIAFKRGKKIGHPYNANANSTKQWTVV